MNANKLSPSGGYWEPGVVLQDNYIYNHGFKGMDASGNFMTIRGNTNDRDFLDPGGEIYGLGRGWTLTGNGYKTHIDNGSSDAFQSRAFDLAGKNIWVEDNLYWETGTAHPSNDGEGILCQKHGGTDVFSWAITHNTGLNGGGTGEGYIMSYDVDQYGCLMAWNDSPSTLGSVNVTRRELIDVTYVDNQTADGLRVGIAFTEDVITLCPETTPDPPLNVMATGLPEERCILISWEDNSSSEIGFRVDRRPAGSSEWSSVTYRPRKSAGSDQNLQLWKDYMAPANTNYEYRVLALDCEQHEEGSSEITEEVNMNNTVGAPAFEKGSKSTAFLYPNPAGDFFRIECEGTARLDIYDTNGKMIREISNYSSRQVDIRSFEPGVYLVKLTLAKDPNTFFRLVKE